MTNLLKSCSKSETGTQSRYRRVCVFQHVIQNNAIIYIKKPLLYILKWFFRRANTCRPGVMHSGMMPAKLADAKTDQSKSFTDIGNNGRVAMPRSVYYSYRTKFSYYCIFGCGKVNA